MADLREEIALKRWCELTGEKLEEWTWEQAKINAPMSTKSVLQEYDFYASVFRAKVDEIKNPYQENIESDFSEGFIKAMDTVKELLK